MLLHEAVESYIRYHLSKQRQPKPAIGLLRRYIPLLPNTPMEDLTRYAVVKWHSQIGETAQSSANKVKGLLGHCYVTMKDWCKYDGPNPCEGVKRFKRPKRTRVVQPSSEMKRLLDAIEKDHSLAAQCLILIALYTGLRKMEIVGLEWTHFDIKTGTGVYPRAKGSKSYRFTLPADVLVRLKRLPRLGPFVFVSKHGTPHGRTWANDNWARIRARAGLDDVHFHDLRRTYGSWLDMMGVPLQKISKLLNHADVQTTQIYIGGIDLTDQDQPITAALAKRIQATKEAM